jgi:hypothetical protein
VDLRILWLYHSWTLWTTLLPYLYNLYMRFIMAEALVLFIIIFGYRETWYTPSVTAIFCILFDLLENVI